MTEPEMDIRDRTPDKQLKPARATEVVSATGATRIRNFEDIMRVAAVAHKSGMLPKDVTRVEQAFWLIYNALDLGLPASSAFKFLYMTKGRRVAMTTKGQHAVIYRSGLCESYKEWIEGKDEAMRAVATTQRKGFAEPFTKEFSYADANAAGLLEQKRNHAGEEYDSTYQKYLKDMLQARARERVFAVAFPDVTGGLPSEGIAEEIERNEREELGGAAAQPREAHVEAQPTRALAPGGPDPLLEALRGKEAEPEPELVEAPVEAEVVEPKALEIEPPPDEDEDPELF